MANVTVLQKLSTENIRTRMIANIGNEQLAMNIRTNMLNIVRSNKKFEECDAGSILNAACQAASMGLSLSPSLGQAYVVPYKTGSGYCAQYQVGWKGFYQLAMRSGQYRTINADVVYEGEIETRDRLSGKITWKDKVSDKVVGYFASFVLLNGFEKTIYMSVEEMRQHAEKYSQSYSYDVRYKKKSSVWSTQFDTMAIKTILKALLSKYGILSMKMERAIVSDQSVINQDGTYRYIDNEKKVDVETGEVVSEQPLEQVEETTTMQNPEQDELPFD